MAGRGRRGRVRASGCILGRHVQRLLEPLPWGAVGDAAHSEEQTQKRPEMPRERPTGPGRGWGGGRLRRVFRDQVRNVSAPSGGPRMSHLWHRRPVTGAAIAEAVAETAGTSTRGWPAGARWPAARGAARGAFGGRRGARPADPRLPGAAALIHAGSALGSWRLVLFAEGSKIIPLLSIFFFP